MPAFTSHISQAGLKFTNPFASEKPGSYGLAVEFVVEGGEEYEGPRALSSIVAPNQTSHDSETEASLAIFNERSAV